MLQDMLGAFRKPMSIRYVTGMRYLQKNIQEVQVCSTVVNK